MAFFGAAYPRVILMAKLSLLLLYLRLFSGHRKTRYLVWVGMVCCCLMYTVASIFQVVLCSPWPGETRTQGLASSRCARTKVSSIMTTAFNAMFDFHLPVIPISVVWHLQTPRKKRIAVCSVFMFGFL